MAHVCPMCEDFAAPTFQLLQVHLFRVHSGNFNISCCNTSFKTASAYRKHVQRNHKSLDSISSNCNQAGSEYDGADASTSSESCDHEDSTDCNGSHSLNDHKVNIAMWILKLKESHKLTQVCVDRVLQDVSELCTITIVELGEAVKSALESVGVRFSDVPGLQDLFATSSPFNKPFNGLLTHHHQLKFYSTHLKFIVSCLSACFIDYYKFMTRVQCLKHWVHIHPGKLMECKGNLLM